MTWFFLLSGLFLGWSLGANDAANVFGTAVGTKMVKFRVAALVASIFVILGAVISGAGAAHTLGKLGSVNALGGSFTVALAAALTVSWMTKLGLPVSTTQAIVGAIVGWDLFSGSLIDTGALSKIVSTWVISPLLTCIFAYLLFSLVRWFVRTIKIHILEVDLYTRLALILIGAFGSYSLGANNIANVMGVFVTANPFPDVNLFGILTLSGTQILFLLGGVAIAIGIYSYSHKVMKTVGSDLFKLSPIAALTVVLAESLVLFMFASERLESLLIKLNLPTIPLVPISSSQAVVGGVIGIALAKGGGRAINFKILGKIVWGWIVTPVTAGVISFFALFFMQNVFQQKVYEPIAYTISEDVHRKLMQMEIMDPGLERITGKVFLSGRKFKYVLKHITNLNSEQINEVIRFAEIDSLKIDSIVAMEKLSPKWFTYNQIQAVKKLHGKVFAHKWQLVDALSSLTDEWKFRDNTRHNRPYNRELAKKYEKLFEIFSISRWREKPELLHELMGLQTSSHWNRNV